LQRPSVVLFASLDCYLRSKKQLLDNPNAAEITPLEKTSEVYLSISSHEMLIIGAHQPPGSGKTST
jgi:hypothetical protein